MILALPASLMGTEPGAMVYVNGSTTINGTAVPHSSLVFPGDTIQTKSSSQADINVLGAFVTIFENSSVKFASDHVSIDQGSAYIATTKRAMAAQAGLITVNPASPGWTEFQVIHLNDSVQIIARKGDVDISDIGDDGSETETLAQGQSVTLDQSASTGNSNEKKKKRKKRAAAGAPPAAQASVLDNPIVIGVGAGAVGFGLGYVLSRSGSPVSPAAP